MRIAGAIRVAFINFSTHCSEVWQMGGICGFSPEFVIKVKSTTETDWKAMARIKELFYVQEQSDCSYQSLHANLCLWFR